MNENAKTPKKSRLPLVCAAVVLVSLLLPLAVFGLWDRALLTGAGTQTAADDMPDTVRQNEVACLLYDCTHLLGVTPGDSVWIGEGWSSTDVSTDLTRQTRRTLQAMQRAGLLDQDLTAALKAACNNTETLTWQAATAAGPLTYIGSQQTYAPAADENTPIATSFSLTMSASGLPLAFSCTPGTGVTVTTADPDAMAKAYIALLGLDTFTDWQPVAWEMYDANSAAYYSAEAQVYLAVGGGADYRFLSTGSMDPDTYAQLAAQYSAE